MSVTIYQDDNDGGYSYEFFDAPVEDLNNWPRARTDREALPLAFDDFGPCEAGNIDLKVWRG